MFRGGRHRLRRIARDIEHGLNELLAVGRDLGQAGIVIPSHGQRLGKLSEYETTHAFQYFVDVGRCGLHALMRLQQALHQILQAIRFLDDDLGVFAQGGVGQFVFEQLRCAANTAQRIFDFMREVAHKLTMPQLEFDEPFFTPRA